jgi:hypothetical protein
MSTTLPIWATSVPNPTDELCECRLLPYLAQVPLTTANGKHRRSTKSQLVCQACLLWECYARADGTTFKQAQDFADALTPPEEGPSRTREELQRLFKKGHSTIASWERWGWLKVPPHGHRSPVLIPHADLIAFMGLPAAWLAWNPAAMPEGELSWVSGGGGLEACPIRGARQHALWGALLRSI